MSAPIAALLFLACVAEGVVPDAIERRAEAIFNASPDQSTRGLFDVAMDLAYDYMKSGRQNGQNQRIGMAWYNPSLRRRMP
eukprot:6161982-Pyramimonas_sp.AAC.1